MTDNELLDLLKSTEKKVLLIKIRYHDPNSGYNYLYLDNGYNFKISDGIGSESVTCLGQSSKLTIKNQINGITKPIAKNESSVIEFYNINNELDYLLDMSLSNQTVQIFIGKQDDDFSNFNTLFEGYIDDKGLQIVDLQTFKLKLIDKFNSLKTTLNRDFIEFEGKDIILPVCLGTVFNAKPVLIDKLNQIYQVDAYNIDTITQMRVNGNPTTLFTFDNSPGDNYYKNLGQFQLTTNPGSSIITCDVQGRKVDATTFLPSASGDFISTASDIIKHVILLYTDLTADDLDIDSFDAHALLKTAELGYYSIVKKDVSFLINQCLVSTLSYARFNNSSQYELNAFVNTDAIDHELNISEFKRDNITLQITEQTAHEIIINYKPNYTVQKNKLSGAIIETQPELVELYQSKHSQLITDRSLDKHDIDSITFISAGVIRIAFTNSIDPSVAINNLALVTNTQFKKNQGMFNVIAVSQYYIDVENLAITDDSFDETNGNLSILNYINNTKASNVDTLLYNRTDAIDLKDDLIELFGNSNQKFKVDNIVIRGLLFQIGDVIKIDTVKFNLNLSNCIILSNTLNLNTFISNIEIIRFN